MKGIAYGAVIGLASLSGCGGLSSDWKGVGFSCQRPAFRKGYYASATAGTIFLGSKDLGIHNSSEKNGQVYTCKGGHVDIAHLRKTADWTAFLAQKTYENLMENKREFSFKLVEPSKYHIKLDYPDNWNNLLQTYKQDIAKEVSIDLGEYFSYTGVTWHEMLTWYGYKITGVWSEFPSAFSWDDQFSNLLGSYLAGKALRKGGNFNQTFTNVLNQELEKLGIQSKRVAKKASERVRGRWWSGGAYLFVNIKKRNLDIGEDGYVTPFLIPISECEEERPVSYSVPNGDVSKYYFSMKLEIEPRTGSGKRISKIIGKSRVNPKTDFPVIMNSIKKDAIKRLGPDSYRQ